jgi:hypothetical protein
MGDGTVLRTVTEASFLVAGFRPAANRGRLQPN